jgi:hypothetical protein
MEPKQTLHATATPAFAGIEVLGDRLQIGINLSTAVDPAQKALSSMLARV